MMCLRLNFLNMLQCNRGLLENHNNGFEREEKETRERKGGGRDSLNQFLCRVLLSKAPW